MSAQELIRADLDALGALDGLGAVALELAGEIDDPDNSATSKANCAKALQAIMGELRDRASRRTVGDSLDELKQRRRARVAAAKG